MHKNLLIKSALFLILLCSSGLKSSYASDSCSSENGWDEFAQCITQYYTEELEKIYPVCQATRKIIRNKLIKKSLDPTLAAKRLSPRMAPHKKPESISRLKQKSLDLFDNLRKDKFHLIKERIRILNEVFYEDPNSDYISRPLPNMRERTSEMQEVMDLYKDSSSKQSSPKSKLDVLEMERQTLESTLEEIRQMCVKTKSGKKKSARK